MTDHAAEDYEDVTMYTLDDDVEEQLLLAHNECTFIWSNKEGWPVGVIMSYVWREGRFWLTASGQRARDQRPCVATRGCASSSRRPARRCPATRRSRGRARARCTTAARSKDWFYPELAAALNPDDPARAASFQSFLDSPRRVILEVEPTQRIGYDGAKMRVATAAWLAAREQD